MKIRITFFAGLLFLTVFVQEATAQIPNSLLQAVIEIESSNRPRAQSKDGCRGLGQIQKETWYWVCELMGESWSFDEAFDPEKNIRVTEFYLAWLRKYLKGKGHYSLELLLASYNAGPGAVRRHGWKVPPYPETTHYIKKVKKKLSELRKL